jgi:hypothetical protein
VHAQKHQDNIATLVMMVIDGQSGLQGFVEDAAISFHSILAPARFN